MPLRSQIPARLSARAVYKKQSTSKKTSEKGRGQPKKSSASPKRAKSLPASQTNSKKGRGRPRKLTASPVKVKSNLQKRNSPNTRKRKTSVSFKSTTEVIEDHSSEADLSSEGEETEQSNDEDLIEDAEEDSNDVEVSGEENDLEEEVEETESSGEEGDIEEDIVVEDEDDEEEEELASTDEIEGEQDDSEEACYSFPGPGNQSLSDLETAKDEQDDASTSSDNSSQKKKNKDRKSQVQLKKTIKKEENDEQEDASSSSDNSSKKKTNEDRISQVQLKKNIKKEENAQNGPNSRKRKITQENTEEAEEEENEFKPKKKKRIRKSNLPVDSDARIYSPPGSSRIPSFSPQHHFSPHQSFRSSAISLNPHVDSMDSLVRLNKTVPCGNIAADQAFRYLIGPTLPVDFFHNMFEKMPFTVPRENRNYYRHLFSGNDLNTMLKDNNLDYKVHIDVVKYSKGMRVPVVGDGRAYNSTVWEDYKQGFSLRVRNPQAYNKNLWRMCSLLQEYFSSTVGCNIYLTPPKAQGFPPHYDDIDAFIVQVEGRKYWKVYYPRYPEEELARYSSKDFTQSEIGTPIVEVCLNAGEMLYIPRGYIHQAATDADYHSLHLTFSTNQLNTWGDFLLIAASKAVEKAMLNDVTFRQSIPKDYMDFIGTCVANNKAFKRYELTNKVKELAQKAMSYIDVDEAADLHSLKFIEAALPPVFNKIEKEHSLHGNGSHWKNGEVRLKGLVQEDTEIQLIKKRSLRLVIGDNNPRLYHTLENQRDPRPVAEETAAAYVDFDMDAVPAYLFLLHRHPDFVKVKDLPLDNPLDRVSFASSLYDNGLIITKEPLPRGSDEDYDIYTTSDDDIIT